MPLGGLIPYDDEEERRRRMLTPPIFPDAAPTTVTPPRPTVIPGGGDMPTSPVVLDPPTRRQRFESERDAFMRQTPGRGKSALTGALEGFAGGGGLLGAITGAAGGAISPRRLREQQFNRDVRPELMERFRFEDADIAAQRQVEENALNDQFRTAQIGELNRRNLPEPPRPRSPIRSDRGLYDPERGGIIPGTEPSPAPPKQDLRFTNQGLIDINQTTPEQRGKLTPYQRPRERGAGGGSAASSKKDMRGANVEMRTFQRLKAEADRANREGDEEMFAVKMAEVQEAADRIDALYGDVVEVGVGEGGWPYVKFRQEGRGKATPQKQPARKQGRQADPLGIR